MRKAGFYRTAKDMVRHTKLSLLGRFSVVVLLCGVAAANDALVPGLADIDWQLVEFQSMDDAIGVLRPHDAGLYHMRLQGDGTVSMRLNCNRASGTWQIAPSSDVDSGQFTFGPLAVTRALCPPPSMDEQIARDAAYVRGYVLRDGKLALSLMADAGIYVWQPAPAKAATVTEAGEPVVPLAEEAGGPRNWRIVDVRTALKMRDSPSTRGAVIARLSPDRVLDNLGCRASEGRVWCDVQPLGGGPRGYVAAEFLSPAISPSGVALYGPDNSALRAGDGQFDARGEIPCARYAGQPMTRCAFAVARAGGGYATVVIDLDAHTQRMIFFRMGVPIGNSSSEAARTGPFSARKEGDLHFIRIGDERYEIPDAVILGG